MTYACLAGCISSGLIPPNGLKGWYDGADINTITKTYQNLSATGSGTSSTKVISASVDQTNLIQAGEKLRIGGTDIYTVASVSTTTINTVETLTTTYTAGSALALDRISQWNDKSGNGYNLPQGTAAQQAVYNPAQKNGLSVLTWNGLNRYAVPAGLLTALSAINNTIFLVSNSTSSNSTMQQRIIGMTNGGTGRLTVDYANSAADAMSANDTTTLVTGGVTINGVTKTNFNIITAFRNGTTQSIQVNNGTAQTNTNAANITLTIGNIGDSAATGIGLIGNIGEIIFYNRVLSASEIILVNRYLSTKWAITIS